MPVIIFIFTAKGQEIDEKLCRGFGVTSYITKPYSAEALVEQIEALLANLLPDVQPP